MNIETSLSIGDTVWMIDDYKIVNPQVIHISIGVRIIEGKLKQEIQYQLSNYAVVFDGTEGKFYFRTRQELVDFIAKSSVDTDTNENKTPTQLRIDRIKEAVPMKLHFLDPSHPNYIEPK